MHHIKIIASISFFLILIFTSACRDESLYSDIDWKRGKNGEIFLLDTQKNWNTWVTIVGVDINHELNGFNPPGGLDSWNQRWIGSIEELEKGRQENYEKYINYIIDRREEAGLPPLRR